MEVALLVGTAVDQAEMPMVMVRETAVTEMETKDACASQIDAQVGQEAVAIQEADLIGFPSWTSTRMMTIENR